jgi:hypothetical protein
LSWTPENADAVVKTSIRISQQLVGDPPVMWRERYLLFIRAAGLHYSGCGNVKSDAFP